MQRGFTLDEIVIRPNRSELESREDVDITTSIAREDTILHIPVISAPMSAITGERMASAMFGMGGLGFVHRYMSIDDQANIAESLFEHNIDAGFSTSSDPIRAYRLIDAGATILTMDVAHGWSQTNINLLRTIHRDYPHVKLISGNITESDALWELSKYVDAVRVGIGEGSACITRDVAGVNVPLATCLEELYETKKNSNLDTKLIVDGGVRNTGDIVKCLALGADAVISGFLFKGLEEAESESYFGMASKAAMERRAEDDPDFQYDSSIHTVSPEGVWIPVSPEQRTTVDKRMTETAAGIRIGMSYVGARNINELRERATFMVRKHDLSTH